MEPFRTSDIAGRAARPHQRRHRPDHPQAVFEAHRAHRLRRLPLLRLARSTAPAIPTPTSCSTIRVTKARRYSSPAKISAAARAANTRPGRFPTTVSAPSSLPPSPTSSSPTPARTASCSSGSPRSRSRAPPQRARPFPAINSPSRSRTQTVTDSHGFTATFEIDPFRKFCLIEGLDDIGLTLRHAAAVRQV